MYPYSRMAPTFHAGVGAVLVAVAIANPHGADEDATIVFLQVGALMRRMPAVQQTATAYVHVQKFAPFPMGVAVSNRNASVASPFVHVVPRSVARVETEAVAMARAIENGATNRDDTAAPASLIVSNSTTRRVKSKTTLLILEMLGLGFFGVDRIYLGGNNLGLGIAKLFTAGGFGIWFLIDWIAIVGNAISNQKSIDTLSMHYTFKPDTVHTAHVLGIVGLTLVLVVVGPFCCCCCLSVVTSFTLAVASVEPT